MAKVAGKYQLVENKNFYQFLLDVGVPEEKAKETKEVKGTLEVLVDGNQVTVASEPPPNVTKYVIGQEVEEKINEDTTFKSTVTLDGNIFKISSTKDGESTGTRTFTFSDSGLEIAFAVPKDGKTLTASRIYKRI